MGGESESTKLTPEEEAEMEKEMKEFWGKVVSLYAEDHYFRLCIDTLGMWSQVYAALDETVKDGNQGHMICTGYADIVNEISELLQEIYGFAWLDTDSIMTAIENKEFWGVCVPETEPTYKEYLEAYDLRNSRALVNRVLRKKVSKKSTKGQDKHNN